MSEAMISLDDAILKCVSFTSAPEYGYDPRASILDGSKTTTLRTRSWKPGLYECSIDGKRADIIVMVTKSETFPYQEYLTDDFAYADGIHGGVVDDVLDETAMPPAEALRLMLMDMYNRVPLTMVVNSFRVVWVKREGRWFSQSYA